MTPPSLILGPLQRYAGERAATIWVETDGACDVAVRLEDGSEHRSRSFHVEGHNYALVHVTGLTPGERYGYEVFLDGVRRWPASDSPFPPSVIRPQAPNASFSLAFGSCRVALPNRAPYTLTRSQDKRGRGTGALYTLARRMQGQPMDAWPDALLMLGDQIYADEVSPGTREFIRTRRGTKSGPGEQVADFQEYTHLYYDAWGDPMLRWLLSTVPVAMIFDDHDVHDDWNASEAWVKKMREKPWWNERITSGFMSYWIYQHLGNLSPEDLAKDGLLRQVLEAEDAGPVLREFAHQADREPGASRWSYHRDFGNTRLVVLDTRAGRVLEEGRRSMLDPAEWSWVEEHAKGGFDHLLIGSSLPAFLAPGLHELEAWNEAVCGGAWGQAAAKIGEILRQAVDLEHWSAFQSSFKDLVDLLGRVGAGERGDPPASITVLSGDVHHGYLAEVEYPRDRNLESAVYQAVCSPLRNTLGAPEQLAMRLGWSRLGERVSRALARAAGIKPAGVNWRLTHEKPWFENHVGTVELRGRRANLKVERAVPAGTEDPDKALLEKILEHELA